MKDGLRGDKALSYVLQSTRAVLQFPVEARYWALGQGLSRITIGNTRIHFYSFG